MGLVAGLLLGADPAGAADLSLWGKQMQVTFSGYTPAEPLTNFPALVILGTNITGFSYSDFLSGTNADLRFTDSTQTNELNYEIDTWNTNGSSYVWVQVPLLTNSASIWAYWGRNGVSAPAYTTNGMTWDGNYRAVWHFADGAGLSITDSTTNGNTLVNSSVTVANGVVSGSAYFNGSAHLVTANNLKLASVQQLSISAWMNQPVFDNSENFLMELSPNANSNPDGAFFIIPNGNSGAFHATLYGFQGGGNRHNGMSVPRPSAGAWHHYTFVFDRASATPQVKAIYVNGVAQPLTLVGTLNTLAAGSYFRDDKLYLMSRGGTSLRNSGSLDEVRFRSVLLSSNWVWAEYMTQASNSLFAVNSEVEAGVAPDVICLPASNVMESSANLNGYLSSTGQYETAVWLYWGETDGGTDPGAWADHAIWAAPQPIGAISTNVVLEAGKECFYRFAASNTAQLTWSPSSAYLITDPLTVSVSPASIGENVETGIFTIARSATLTNGALTVFYQATGTASNGLDYSLVPATSVTMDPGVASATVQAIAWPDSLTEDDETAILVLEEGSYVTNASSTATLTITNMPTATTNAAWWVGAAGPANWSLGPNWTNGLPPANNGSATLRFDQTDNGRVTRLDPENLATPTNVWRIGALTVANSLAVTDPMVDFTHTHDLNGKRLIVEGNVNVGTLGTFSNSWARTHFTNGVLQIGTASVKRNLTIGSGTDSTANRLVRYGELKIAPGATLDGYLQDVIIGDGWQGGGTLDLRGAIIAGGVLDMRDLKMGVSGQGSRPRREMHLLLDADTDLDEIRIARDFWFGGGQQNTPRMGDPDNGYRLPPDLSITVGTESVRGGDIMITHAPYNRPFEVWLEATSGGQFTGYVTNMIVHRGYFAGGSLSAVTRVDLRAMTNILLDVSTLFAVGGPAGNPDTQPYDATVQLGAGTVTTRDLQVGTSLAPSSTALLELNGTRFAVTNGAMVGISGTMTNIVNGFAAGLDLGAAATLTLDGGLHIRFTADQNGGDPEPQYWGLRWAGDRRSELATLNSAGKLTWSDTSGSDKFVSILYTSGFTYVVLSADAAPIPLGRNLNLELNPPGWGTVVIGVDDVDAGSFDPAGNPITSRTLYSLADTTSGEAYVTFNSAGSYTVWLGVTSAGGTASNDYTVTVAAAPAAGVTNSLTWAGGATLSLMDRPEWFWSRNWVGETAPTNPTTGTLRFDDTAVGASLVEADRTIGGLTVASTAGTNVINLGGHTLTIDGNTLIGPWFGDAANFARLVLTNGTLRIGAPDTPRNLTVGVAPSSLYFGGELTLSPGLVFRNGTPCGSAILPTGTGCRRILISPSAPRPPAAGC